jgi:hypothetical protein
MNNAGNISLPKKIRLAPMRFMYVLTSIIALPLGLMMVLTPEVLTDSLGWVLDEPLFPGAYGGCLIAFGILCALGWRSPITFAPVLLFQFTYKLSWLLLVWAPLWIKGELPDYHIFYTVGMVTAMLIDIYVVPFRYLLRKESSTLVQSGKSYGS